MWEDHSFQECGQQFTHEGSLIGHKHAQCVYKESRKDSLTKHHNSEHRESNQIPRGQSEYHATTKDNLTIHQMSRHPIMIYPSEQVDYKTSAEDSLEKHHQSVHVANNHICQEFGQQLL